MAEYIERQAAIDLFYPVDPENDGSDGCTVVYKMGLYLNRLEVRAEVERIDLEALKDGKGD